MDPLAEKIISVLAIVLGVLYLGIPRVLLAFRAWWMEHTIGAKFIPSERTVRIYRSLGALFLVGGILWYFGYL